MTDVPTEDLVLLALAPDPPPTDRTIDALTERLGVDSLSDRVDLVATVEDLRESGVVERFEDDGETKFLLTEAGHARADEVYRRLSALATVVVEDGERRNRTLATAAQELDRSLVAVAADLSESGVYYAGDAPSQGFVDRETERDRCRSVLASVRADSTPRAVVLTGPAGIGKTTLADHLLETAGEWHALRARVGAAAGPYRPVRDLLSADGTDPSTVFTGGGPAVEDATELAAQRSALFESVLDELCPPGADRPRLLFLDDFHHADPGTVAFVRYLLERDHDRPVAVLVGVRPGERLDDLGIDTRETGTDGDEDPGIGDGPDDETAGDDRSGSETAPDDGTPGVADAGEIPDDRIVGLELEAFDREYVRELLEREVGRRGAPDALVEAVHERTGGNPLFVAETVASLLDTDQLDRGYEWYPETPAEVDLPSAVEAVVDRRVERFDDRARDLLRWTATAGEQVPVAVLEAVTESLDPETLSNYCSAFAEAGLIEWIGGDDGRRVAFHSEVVREVLYDALDAEDRRRRHARLAEALSERVDRGRAERAATVAHHYRRGGDDRTAVEWFRRAADRALDVYAHETALDHLEAALEIAREYDDQPVVEVASTVAAVHETLGEYEAARRYGQFARERATTDDQRRQTLARLASIAVEQGANERAVELADEGLAVGVTAGAEVDSEPPSSPGDPDRTVEADDGGDELDCQLLGHRASALRQLGRYDEARDSARRQRAVAEAIDDRAYLARALKNLGTIADLQSDYETARGFYEESRDAFEAAGDRHGVGKATNNLGLLAALVGEYDEARTHLEESLEVFRSVGARRDVARGLTNLGMVAFRESDYESARSWFEDAADLERAMGARQGLGATLNNLGLVALEQGDYGSAREYLQECLDICTEVGDRRGVGKALNNLGQVSMREGDHDRAREYFEDAVEIYREVDSPRDVATTRAKLGKLERTVGNLRAASEYYERALTTFEEIETPHDIAEAKSLLAEVRYERGDADRATTLLDEAEALAREIDDATIVAACLAQRGVMAWDRGDREAASEAADEALSVAAEAATLTGQGLEPLDPLWRLVERASDAGERETVRQWCRLALERIETDPGVPEADRRKFEHRLAELPRESE